MFWLYLLNFSSIVRLCSFSSSRAISQYFKNNKYDMQINKWCYFFGSSVASHVLLHHRKFYTPRTMLNPTLQLQLNDLNENECRKNFWLIHSEIKQLILLLKLSAVLSTPVHYDHVIVVEAFCFLLYHISYPNRCFDVQKKFCQHKSSLCRIFY